MSNKAKLKGYEVDFVKMIRNNNIADEGVMKENKADLYFMLDYFDLLFHKSLMGDEKVYRKYWHIESDISKGALAYKASYKTLSLYAAEGNSLDRLWKSGDNGLSDYPFLGVIQINIVYYIYESELQVEKTLTHLENEISQKICAIFKEDPQLCYYLYRSSTSSDFCMILKSNKIEDIFKASMAINNMVIFDGDNKFNFNTYTNIGIECVQGSKGDFCTFSENIIQANKNCQFALRFTAPGKIANQRYKKSDEIKERYLLEHMDGLFGRYDFSVRLSMEEFAQIYPVLCKSKVIGNKEGILQDKNKSSFVDLLREGIETGDIQIINERVLVPLAEVGFEISEKEINKGYAALKEDENALKEVVRAAGEKLRNSMNEFEKLRGEFIEERRAFIDICRELREVINTYVPQGMDHDSNVNCQILVSDLQVVFENIKDWKEFYEKQEDSNVKKLEREHFLSDLRVAVEAINQYYKFLQNVNAQTWQSPIYEIQTQLDSEKMMIAYREFLYEYFCMYKKRYNDRPMFYPIIYPDMSTDKVYVQAPFKRQGKAGKNLLTCKVPSFEYYGRVYNMIPWLLHEASHSFRTLKREERNLYLSRTILHGVFEQALYKALNKYSNDFGYHQLGVLENDILKIIEDRALEEFVEFCDKEFESLDIYVLQTKLMNFLGLYFDYLHVQLERTENEKNRQKMQTELLRYFKELNLYKDNSTKVIKYSINHADKMREILKKIFETYYEQVWGDTPKKEDFQILWLDTLQFETELYKQIENMKLNEDEDKYRVREYCFTVRELKRLYTTWYRRGVTFANSKKEGKLWEKCITDIRLKIENDLKDNIGLREVYRIMNMIFGSGKEVNSKDVERVEGIFNILSEEINDLVDHEVAIYRETCSDIYMAASLGLNAFGYCRQSFQTASDISVEDSMTWEEGINVHRFRVVTAVLLGCEEDDDEGKNEGKINAEKLFEKGEEYCYCTLECLRKKWLSGVREETVGLVNNFVDLMRDNVELLFADFDTEGAVTDSLEESALAMYATKNSKTTICDPEIDERRKRIQERYRPIEDTIDEYRHILYRIKYFIHALAAIGKKKKLLVSQLEYGHMKKIYQEYKEKLEGEEQNPYCMVVSEYYNKPETAENMPVQEMLDDTIRFIEEYYYKNRFKVMSSKRIKAEVNKVGKG